MFCKMERSKEANWRCASDCKEMKMYKNQKWLKMNKKCKPWSCFSRSGEHWHCKLCDKSVCFECSPSLEPKPYFKLFPVRKFEWFSTAFVVRWTTFLLSTLSYIVIPVLVIEVSLLLILESANILDVIKDTLALLFLLEINNFLQIRSTPSAGKWTMNIKGTKLKDMSRHKNLFTVIMFVAFALLAAATTAWVHTGLTGRLHPSIVFNPWRDRPLYLDYWPRWYFFFIILLVFVVFALSWALVAFWDRMKSLSFWTGEPCFMAPYFWFEQDKDVHSNSGVLMYAWMVICSYPAVNDLDDNQVPTAKHTRCGELVKPIDGTRWRDHGPWDDNVESFTVGGEIKNMALQKKLFEKSCLGKYLTFTPDELVKMEVNKIKVGDYIQVGEGNCAKCFRPTEGKLRVYRLPLFWLGFAIAKTNEGYKEHFLKGLKDMLDPIGEMDEEYFDEPVDSDYYDDSEDEGDVQSDEESTTTTTTGQMPVGRWTQQYSQNGQLVEVLINDADGRVMAQRRVGDPNVFTSHAGDTSGFGQWSVNPGSTMPPQVNALSFSAGLSLLCVRL